MSEQFEDDLQQALTAAREAHSALLAVLAELGDEDLYLSLRGNWTIRRVIQHLVQSYNFYLAIILRGRGRGVTGSSTETIGDFSTITEAARLLDIGFQTALAATDGVDEETFYHPAPARDGNEYSVLSVIESIAAHDLEHAEQIKTIAKGGKS